MKTYLESHLTQYEQELVVIHFREYKSIARTVQVVRTLLKRKNNFHQVNEEGLVSFLKNAYPEAWERIQVSQVKGVQVEVRCS